ncbi:MAG TPA: hypothetical protein VIN69_00185 [Candidatus Limnocylindria bacterium]
MGLEERERRRCQLDGRIALSLQALRELRDRGVANVDQGLKTVGGSTAIGTGCSRSAFVLRSAASRIVVAIESGSSIDGVDVLSEVTEARG